jgi:hypothetical protein
LRAVSTTNQKQKKSIKSKLEIVAKSLTLLQEAWHLSLQQPETKSIQSKLEILFAKGKLWILFWQHN